MMRGCTFVHVDKICVKNTQKDPAIADSHSMRGRQTNFKYQISKQFYFYILLIEREIESISLGRRLRTWKSGFLRVIIS